MKIILLAASSLVISACTTYIPPPYQASPETTSAFQKTGLGNIEVLSVTSDIDFDNSCPASNGSISLPNKMPFENYIKKSLIEEFTVADMYDNKSPKIKLDVTVKELEYFLSHNSLLSVWDVDLIVDSSNGVTLRIHEHYLFDAGAYSLWNCKKIADAFTPAIQATIFELAKSPKLKELLTPKKSILESNPPQ